MAEPTNVILSGLADEAANQKTAVQQFAAFAALGLQYYSLRFVDVGEGIKNVMNLTTKEIQHLRHLEDEYGLNVTSIASPIGKIKLIDREDGTKNKFVPIKKYLSKDVKHACELAHAFETKLIRGFSFYHPKNEDPWKYVEQAADYLGEIAEVCHRSDLTYGLEIEANLVGQTAELMVALQKKVNHPAMVLIFDAANVVCQGYTTAATYEQYLLMKPYIGWLHIKDYRHPKPPERTGHVDEDAIKNFVPCEIGHGAHELILRDFRDFVPKLHQKLHRRGIPGVFLDLEPHVKGGGQFGGFSGPDGFGVALRSLCKVLDYVGLGYHLRDFADIQAARGF